MDERPEKLIDSIQIKTLDSDFFVNIPIPQTEGSILKLNLDRNAASVYIDDAPGVKNLKVNMTRLGTYFVQGNQVDQEFSSLYTLTRKYNDSLYILNNFFQRESIKSKKDSIYQIMHRIKSTLHDLGIRFSIDSTSQSKVSLKIALETDFSSDLAEFKDYLKQLKIKYPQDPTITKYINKGQSYIYLMENSYKIGDSIPNIDLSVYKRNNIDFYSNTKNINLLVFWSSYSVKSLEILRELSKMEIDPGTQVFSFSLEPDSSSFSVIADQLPSYWINAYNFDSWNGTLARHFLVKDIPFFYKLDSSHIIQYMGPDLPLKY